MTAEDQVELQRITDAKIEPGLQDHFTRETALIRYGFEQALRYVANRPDNSGK